MSSYNKLESPLMIIATEMPILVLLTAIFENNFLYYSNAIFAKKFQIIIVSAKVNIVAKYINVVPKDRGAGSSPEKLVIKP